MYQDNYSVVSVNINFCQRQAKCIDDQDKFQSLKGTDKYSKKVLKKGTEFTECQ